MKRWFLILWCLSCASAATAQLREWVLQPFLEVKGPNSQMELGHFVYGFPNPNTNIPYNVVAAKKWDLEMYSIHSKTDTKPLAYYLGANLVHGDFNGDGWVDLAIHRNIKYLGDTVCVYLGNPTGIDTLPAVTMAEEHISSAFGIMCVGDLNGDRYDDLIITAPGYWDDKYSGRVYIYLGKPNFNAVADFIFSGYKISRLGCWCCSGNFNNDGYDDLALMNYDATDPNPMSGKRFFFLEVYYGGAALDVDRDLYLKGEDPGYGNILAMDANGDGIEDLLWSTANPDKRRHGPKQAVLIFFGGDHFDLQ